MVSMDSMDSMVSMISMISMDSVLSPVPQSFIYPILSNMLMCPLASNPGTILVTRASAGLLMPSVQVYVFVYLFV